MTVKTGVTLWNPPLKIQKKYEIIKMIVNVKIEQKNARYQKIVVKCRHFAFYMTVFISTDSLLTFVFLCWREPMSDINIVCGQRADQRENGYIRECHCEERYTNCHCEARKSRGNLNRYSIVIAKPL